MGTYGEYKKIKEGLNPPLFFFSTEKEEVFVKKNKEVLKDDCLTDTVSKITDKFIEALKEHSRYIKDVYNKDMSYNVNDMRYTLKDLERGFRDCSKHVTNDHQKKELEDVYDIIKNKKDQMKAINDILNRIKTLIPDSNNKNKDHMLVIHFASISGLINKENEVEKDVIEKIDKSIKNFNYELGGDKLCLKASVNGEEKQSTFKIGKDVATELLFKLAVNFSY